MNLQIREFEKESGLEIYGLGKDRAKWEAAVEKFAELIVEECRTVVNKVYRNTPLELCGPLLTADEEIAKHFYGVEE